ncbi:arylsulfatase [soil metagenome]
MKPHVYLALALIPWLSAVSARAEKPNIIPILSDDMGFSAPRCYGGEIETPHLDRLAAGGLRFSQFYNTGRCCPTRASLLTGLYPHQAGVGHMTDDNGLPGYRGDLHRDTPTIAEVLRPAGYRIYMAGKWHVTRFTAPDGPKDNWPLQRGFDSFYGTITGAGSFFDPTTLCRGETYITPENDPDYQPEVYYYTDAIADNAIAFLQDHAVEHADKPFFLYASFTAPHWPMHALPDDIEKYKGKFDGGYGPVRQARVARLKELGLLPDRWDVTQQVGDWSKVEHKEWEARCMEVYAAMIDRMDQQIGRLMAEVERQGRAENTLVLYLQDNGGCAEGMGRQNAANAKEDATYEPLGRDGLQPKIWPPMQTRDGRAVQVGPDALPGPADTYIAYGENWANVSNTPFRLYKHFVHEGGIATPLIAHWPGGIAAAVAGGWNREPAHLIDIMATAVELGGADVPAAEGVSLVPAFAGNSLERAAPIYFEHEGNRAVRDGKWKLVAKGVRGSWELYDMEADRTEMHDLSAGEGDRVESMAAAYDEWADRAGVVPFNSWRE